jgi:hypothetical protein
MKIVMTKSINSPRSEKTAIEENQENSSQFTPVDPELNLLL